MSRKQIAPGVWVPEPPSSALIRHRTYAVVPAEVIGSMRPVLSPGGNTHEGRSGYRQKALTVTGKPR